MHPARESATLSSESGLTHKTKAEGVAKNVLTTLNRTSETPESRHSHCWLARLESADCKSRKSNDTKNPAKAKFTALLQLQRSVAPIRGSMVVFARNKVVPHVATHETHQRSRKFSFIAKKRLATQSANNRPAALEIRLPIYLPPPPDIANEAPSRFRARGGRGRERPIPKNQQR